MIIIILIVAISIFIMNSIIDRKIRNTVIKLYLCALFLQLLLLAIYRLNLHSIGRVVYFSDAEEYWNNTMALLNGDKLQGYNQSYTIICYFLQITSPFVSVAWNNLYNLLIFDLSVLLCTKAIYCNSVSEASGYLNNNYNSSIVFLVINIFNPLICYGLMRNLKDATFLFLVCLVAFIMLNTIFNSNLLIKILVYIFFIILTPIFQNLRPWGILVTATAILWLLLKDIGDRRKKTIACVSICILGMGLFVYGNYLVLIVHGLMVWREVIFDRTNTTSFIAIILSTASLFLGPGYVRALTPDQSYVYQTVTGNAAIFIGSLICWTQIGYLLANVKNPIKKWQSSNIYIKFLAVITLIYIVIYSVSYNGTAEIRIRAVLYVIFSASMLGLFGSGFSRQIILKSAIITTFIFIFGTVASIL